MNLASIDIGSNTVILLLGKYNEAGSSFKSIANFYAAPRISKGLIQNGVIPENKIEELIAVLDNYNKILTESNTKIVIVKATNAFRIAKNASYIKNLINERYNWNLQIIDGEVEAQLTFLGCAHPFIGTKYKNAIDIGGGSTELMTGSEFSLITKKSMQIGVVSLSEKFFNSIPPSDQEILSAKDYINNQIISSTVNIDKKYPTIAVAGTPTTLACIKLGIRQFDAARIENTRLTKGDLHTIIKELTFLAPQEVKSRYGQVVDGREDVLLGGTIILQSLMEYFGIEEVIVSSRGLRYGAIFEYLNNNKLPFPAIIE